MSSHELTAWQAFYAVRTEESEHQRHVLESGDGQVIVSGRDEPDEDEELGDAD